VARLTVDEVARATNGRIVSGDPRSECAGAAIDSRKVKGGEIFFALPGTRTDGHRFVGAAAAQGAGAVVIQDEVPPVEGAAVVRVNDTLLALQDLAHHVRTSGTPRRLAGITGSMGKTTTKKLLAAMLATRFRTAKTEGNLNNLIGFPLCLLNVPDGTEWMVAEMGMSVPGELRRLSEIGRPDAAVFTVVRPVHLEFFDSVRGIAEAKSELLAGLAADGPVIANADDPEVAWIARRHLENKGARVVWYGIEATEVDVRLKDLAPGPEGVGSRFRVEAGGESANFELPLHGLYNAENCLAAAACAWSLGLWLAEIAAAVREIRPAAHRGVVHSGSFTVVDDSYNSNPAALTKALESAARLPVSPGGRRVAILGDMLELGPGGPSFHRVAGEQAARLGFSPVLAVGPLSREMAAGAGGAGRWVPDSAAAAEWAEREVREGDVVLVKASRGIGLDAVVRRLVPNKPGSGEEAH
jgi:UDP-N-acetylmuramoyl-tripeptide--D-alanyl-D-alanine ligase